MCVYHNFCAFHGLKDLGPGEKGQGSVDQKPHRRQRCLPPPFYRLPYAYVSLSYRFLLFLADIQRRICGAWADRGRMGYGQGGLIPRMYDGLLFTNISEPSKPTKRQKRQSGTPAAITPIAPHAAQGDMRQIHYAELCRVVNKVISWHNKTVS